MAQIRKWYTRTWKKYFKIKRHAENDYVRTYGSKANRATDDVTAFIRELIRYTDRWEGKGGFVLSTDIYIVFDETKHDMFHKTS